MDIFATNLRKRAKQLGISNAEAARRCGLSERRYAHYVQGIREPNLATLVKIARFLGTTPNHLLGIDDFLPLDERAQLLDKLTTAAQALPKTQLAIVLTQVEALVSQK
ncbi:helix-turn-helix domain-containing protein [Pelagibacterium mangrovi]|uniref:helix-turn-helix domain-containing protein n=1 Tax=Pelagibacterium mangrovi TaxID=3119828 RepID=UPI002FCC6BDF